MEKIRRAIVILLKNLLVFLTGGTLGMLGTLVFAESLLKSAISKDVGLGVIVLAPILFLLYSIFFGTLCGAAAVIVYNVVKFFRSRK